MSSTDGLTLPNLVIIGAPRCGTTSLFEWLAAHPDVGAVPRKETFYLMDPGSSEFDETANIRGDGLEGYAELFRPLRDSPVRLEATAGYLYQSTALEVLSALPGAPRLVVVLRRPSERIYSVFRYFQGHKGELEPETTFARFLELVEQGSDVVARNEFMREAIAHSRYVEHLDAWVARCGAERLRVLVFEQLRRSPRRQMSDLAGWLGLDPAVYDTYDFPRHNPSYQVRSQGLHRFVTRRLLPLVERSSIKRRLRPLYVALNSRRPEGAADDQKRACLERLDRYFEPHNARLAERYGLDLSDWRGS